MSVTVEELIGLLHSESPADVRRAIDQLRAAGWLTDGTLQGADLRGANLEGATLREADLKRANLSGANLQGADLHRASLRGANLQRASLQLADLTTATLQKTNLTRADLQGANLFEVALLGADLTGANLQGATIEEPGYGRAMFDSKTRLPDGTTWVPGVDLTRFVRPDHAEFWRSDDPESPAHW